jgi:hypothetical protein
MDALISVLVRILEAIFMIGLVGSAVVLILTLIEDAKSLLPGGEKKEDAEKTSSRSRQDVPHLHATGPIV